MKRMILCLLCCLVLTGCTRTETIKKTPSSENSVKTQKKTEFVPLKQGEYDSADTAILLKVVPEKKKLTFRNLAVGKNYTLTYDGTTTFSDKYGGAMTALQFEPGEIVDVTFVKAKKKCIGVQITKDAFTYTGVDNHTLLPGGNGLKIGPDAYKYESAAVLMAEGEEIELLELNEKDIITIKGIDRSIYSVKVERGHGYLRLENDDYFYGGWIEVGQKVIQRVSKDMMLTVPEGKHQVTISHKGGGGVKEIDVARNEEVRLDVGDLEVYETQIGNVLFTLKPESASMYIDGDKADSKEVQSLEYGIHQIIVRAEGYDTITQYFKVAQENANLSMELQKSEESETEVDPQPADRDQIGLSDNNSGMSSNDVETPREDGNYQITIDGPTGVEVYMDGKYIGIAPVSFKKEAGTHVIILRKSGYRTRSYTIQVDSEKKDVRWSFAELVESETIREE